MDSYIQFYRGEKTNELMKDPSSFMLLTQIALRARRTDSFNVKNLKPGEAFIGDYRTIGLTQQQYRTAKKKLEEWGLAKFEPTNRGTIATLLNTDIYNINIKTNNGHNNKQVTNSKRLVNDQITTNNNEKKVNNVNNEFISKKNKNYEKGF